MPKSFYITTTLPYVNAEPHIGFAMEIIRADVIARFKRIEGYDVFFNTGTDEHGVKLFESAQKEHMTPKQYVDLQARQFINLVEHAGSDNILNITKPHFIRTTDEKHIKATHEFWNRCYKAGFIYKKNYQAKYCVGCELIKTDSELVDGKCPLHPNRELEYINEENYFFKFSMFQKPLLEFYEKNPTFVIPEFRFNEIKTFVANGLEDFSISRVAEKMPWGIPVPNDPDHVIYVWFDALVNYISTLGWPENMDQFEKYWKNGTPTQYCGKDNLRQQSAMWQAMLMAADLPCSHQIVIDGFINGEGGIKMSKSLGNAINPFDIVSEYGTDALRYFVLRELSPFEDSPFTMERFKEAYNANLANGIGNLTNRIMKLAETHLPKSVIFENPKIKFSDIFENAIRQFNLQSAMDHIWEYISNADESIQKNQPFKVIKEDKEKGISMIQDLVLDLMHIAKLLEPFLPETSEKIQQCIKENKMPEKPLFLRKE